MIIVWSNETLIRLWAIKPSRFQWQKVIWDFSFSGPGFCSTSPLSIINSSINCLVKLVSQAGWVLMRGPYIHFSMTDHEISKFIFSSTHIRKNKIKKNLIFILLYIKAMFWVVKFKLSFWLRYYFSRLKDTPILAYQVPFLTPILAYQVLLSIGIIKNFKLSNILGIIDSNISNNKTKAP